MKTLRRSVSNRKLLGVCGGIGEYFDTDPTIVRLIFVCLALCGCIGLLGYLIMAIIIPE